MKIVILTQSHLARNPRVLKEATALADRGHNVTILTSIYSRELFKEDYKLLQNRDIRIEIVSDLSRHTFQSYVDKAVRKLAVLANRHLKLESGYSLGYGFDRYLKKCKNLNAELFICHQEMPTIIGMKLIGMGFPVAFDLEDWYSEDLLAEARKERPLRLLRKSEAIALKESLACWTTSRSMGQAMASHYDSPEPGTIYNVFPFEQLIPRKLGDTVKLFWFSQTIGPGRGIEILISALKGISLKFELHLLGNINNSYKEELLLNAEDKFHMEFHDTVSPTKLGSYIQNFDIGLALELKEPLSRNFTITNKLFQYLQAGLPVIASDTAGQKEILETTKAGVVVDLSNINELQAVLVKLISDTDFYYQLADNASQAAYKYNWENEKSKLVEIVESIK